MKTMKTFSQPKSATYSKREFAFTLVELLVVIAVMVTMMAIAAPAVTGIKTASDLTKAAYDLKGTLDQARAYAMANNTFVYVGISEVDSSKDPNVVPQISTGNTPYGRVTVAVVASKDGTRGYDPQNIKLQTNSQTFPLTTSVWTNNSNLIPIGKLQRFENLHLASANDPAPLATTGGMTRPPSDYLLGSSTTQAVTAFGWPLGVVSNKVQYTFNQVIYFDPQGVARVQQKTNADTIPKYIEISLREAHGNAVAYNNANVASLQVDGMNGSTHVYRP